MTQVYDLLDKLKDELRLNKHVNSVSFGDITEVNLNKTDIFPLTHLNISNAVISSNTITFTLQVLCADILDYNKQDYSYDLFYGNDNLQDIMNTQLQEELLQVDDNISVQPFKDRFENELVGWGADIDIIMRNDISIC